MQGTVHVSFTRIPGPTTRRGRAAVRSPVALPLPPFQQGLKILLQGLLHDDAALKRELYAPSPKPFVKGWVEVFIAVYVRPYMASYLWPA